MQRWTRRNTNDQRRSAGRIRRTGVDAIDRRLEALSCENAVTTFANASSKSGDDECSSGAGRNSPAS